MLEKDDYFTNCIEECYKLGDQIDNTLLLSSGNVASESTRNLIKNDFIKIFSYLSAVDGVISIFDAEYINTYFDTEMSPAELKEFICINNIYSTTFEETVPVSFKRVAEYIQKGGNVDDFYIGSMSSFIFFLETFVEDFSTQGNGDKNKTIVNALTKYIDMLCNYSPSSESEENSEKSSDSLDKLLDELNHLIGLTTVKQEINSLIHLQAIKKLREKQGLKVPLISNHLVFYGNPGTGKTTVARLLAKIYREIGVLSKGQLIEVDRADLIGGYVGQTALKVQGVINSALGGILFIDEAYSLTYSDNSNDYGQEAIETLLKAMEDNRNDLIVIVAGYPELMKKFINSNPGLRSRFNNYINFPDYTIEELGLIFVKMCKESDYTVSTEASEEIYQILEQIYEQHGTNFANAREVRNLYERLIISQANRIFDFSNLTNDILMRFEKVDVENAREHYKNNPIL